MTKTLALSLFCIGVRAQNAVVVDGKLDDASWRQSPPSAMTAGGGDVRLAVAGRYLYVGVTMPEPGGRFTARSIGRNPHWEEEDMVRITAGSYPDWTVVVGPLGAWGVETKGVPIPAGNFLGAAARGVAGWTAEVAMPMNDFRAARPSEITVMVERIRAMRPGDPERRWRWPATGVAARIPPALAVEAPSPTFRPTQPGNAEPAIEAARAAALPESGGAWDSAAEWRLLRNEPNPRDPGGATAVKLLHDGHKLAVLARCDVPGGAPGGSDSFTVFLSTSGSTYAQIAVDPSGTISEAAGMSGGQRISRPRTEWRSGSHAIVNRSEAGWTLRLDIPLRAVAAVLGEETPPAEWRVLFARSRPGAVGETREVSVLPQIHTETLACPARYRRLRLSSGSRVAAAAPAKSAPHPLAAYDRRVLAASGTGMIDRHQRERIRRVLESERSEWDAVTSREQWERFRDPRIRALRASLGTLPPRVPLNAIVSKEYQGQGYRRQDVVYRSRPDLWVTANLYLPSPARALTPAIVIVHSHHRPRTQSELQDMGILWARAGAAVLVMDQMGAGERMQNYPWNREAYHSRYVMNIQLGLAGESLLQWMVWDIMRGVDLLLERRDIDPRKIGLLGAVAGGGDPAAVAAALDERIAMVVPFNFGESTPESPRFMPDRNRWPLELADPGGGSWEWTRNMRRGIADQFVPWVVCASVAPRKFVYSFEMGWKVEDLPAWARYRKVFGFYGALDNLDEAHGFGPFPGPGECTNIGPAQRKTLYPELERWFGLAPPAREPDDRRQEAELAALTAETAAKIAMKPVHALAGGIARERLAAARSAPGELRARLAAKLGDIEPAPRPDATVAWKDSRAEGVRIAVEPGIDSPVVLLRPAGARGRSPVAIGVAQGGKERFFAHRGAEMEKLLAKGVAVCLIDVRGTGETNPDSRRGPNSSGIAQAATELMLGNTMLGARLRDLRTTIAYLASRDDIDGRRVAVWGESFVPPDASPASPAMDELAIWQVGPDPRDQVEPLGDLLALLAAVFDDRVRVAASAGGLVSFESMFASAFTYVPQDAIVPGLLEAADIGDLVRAAAPKRIARLGVVDARNRLARRDGTASIVDALAAVQSAE